MHMYINSLKVGPCRLVRSVVGPPSGVCWSSPWHEILHVWNARVQQILENVAMHNHALWEQSMLEFVQFTIGK